MNAPETPPYLDAELFQEAPPTLDADDLGEAPPYLDAEDVRNGFSRGSTKITFIDWVAHVADGYDIDEVEDDEG